ncbi:MAG: hypothetical protein ACI8QD_002682 [Cyclobacteriaceae bacterium]|jgi:hypothetical protein
MAFFVLPKKGIEKALNGRNIYVGHLFVKTIKSKIATY